MSTVQVAYSLSDGWFHALDCRKRKTVLLSVVPPVVDLPSRFLILSLRSHRAGLTICRLDRHSPSDTTVPKEWTLKTQSVLSHSSMVKEIRTIRSYSGHLSKIKYGLSCIVQGEAVLVCLYNKMSAYVSSTFLKSEAPKTALRSQLTRFKTLLRIRVHDD
jgi:hypothetical protein